MIDNNEKEKVGHAIEKEELSNLLNFEQEKLKNLLNRFVKWKLNLLNIIYITNIKINHNYSIWSWFVSNISGFRPNSFSFIISFCFYSSNIFLFLSNIYIVLWLDCFWNSYFYKRSNNYYSWSNMDYLSYFSIIIFSRN